MLNLESRAQDGGLARLRDRLWPSRDDFRRATPATVRGTLLGIAMGILPGGGSTIPSFASYSLEKKLARDPSRFGQGAVEGVAGPEAANNAGAQAGFIPMLALGIPPNAIMALLVGALMIHGIQPGPQIISRQPELFWGLVVSMWIGNLMLVVLNLVAGFQTLGTLMVVGLMMVPAVSARLWHDTLPAQLLNASAQAMVAGAGLPKAVVGIAIALLVLLPETWAAVRAARANRLQTSMNLALGSALASIGLTVPAVVVAATWLELPLVLGLEPKEMAMLAMTFVVSGITLASGRTYLMQGAVHLVVFAAFLFLAFVP
jgi:hypothetical protein